MSSKAKSISRDSPFLRFVLLLEKTRQENLHLTNSLAQEVIGIYPLDLAHFLLLKFYSTRKYITNFGVFKTCPTFLFLIKHQTANILLANIFLNSMC